MRISTLLIILLLLLSCKEQSNEKPTNSTAQKTVAEPTPLSREIEKPKPIKFSEKKFKNFTFKISNNFDLQENLSHSNKQVYLNAQENIGFTIDVEYLPSGFENKSIRMVVVDLNEFGSSINQNNRLNFSDFKLLKTIYADLGNAESVFVSQLSTDISGPKNIEMKVDSYFAISAPYYCSITFTYPRNSENALNLINKIENSFKFPVLQVQEKEITETEKTYPDNTGMEKIAESKVDRPSEYETKKWILNKFRTYADPDFYYNLDQNNLVITTTNNPKTAIEYTIPLCDASISKYTFHSYSNERIKFHISNGGRIKIDRDWKGFPHFESSFDFQFRYSSEDNLITRLNDALENLKYYCPDTKSSNEAF